MSRPRGFPGLPGGLAAPADVPGVGSSPAGAGAPGTKADRQTEQTRGSARHASGVLLAQYQRALLVGGWGGGQESESGWALLPRGRGAGVARAGRGPGLTPPPRGATGPMGQSSRSLSSNWYTNSRRHRSQGRASHVRTTACFFSCPCLLSWRPLGRVRPCPLSLSSHALPPDALWLTKSETLELVRISFHNRNACLWRRRLIRRFQEHCLCGGGLIPRFRARTRTKACACTRLKAEHWSTACGAATAAVDVPPPREGNADRVRTGTGGCPPALRPLHARATPAP
eukprot:gene13971-biopygen2038